MNRLTNQNPFDIELTRVNQIRGALGMARGNAVSSDTFLAQMDCRFLLGFIDKLWKEYSTILTAREPEARAAEPSEGNRWCSVHGMSNCPHDAVKSSERAPEVCGCPYGQCNCDDGSQRTGAEPI